jgi:hypothetical protein
VKAEAQARICDPIWEMIVRAEALLTQSPIEELEQTFTIADWMNGPVRPSA